MPRPMGVLVTDLFALNDLAATLHVNRMQIAGRWLAVVDGVYQNPDAVRRFALSQHYGSGGGIYPGRFARVPLSIDPLLELINVAIPSPQGRPLVSHPDYHGITAFAMLTASGRDLSPHQQQPHSDGFCEYAAILYLSQPDDCVGGTSFWRHRRADLEYAPTGSDPRTLDAIQRYGADSPLRLFKQMLNEALAEPIGGYITESNGTWEQIKIVEMRQNRLVVYDASLFHSICVPRSDWTPDPRRPRITQNQYLNWASTSS